MKPRISMMTLGVNDLAAASQFYEVGLGLPRMPMDDANNVATREEFDLD